MNLVFVTEARFIKNKIGIYGDPSYNTELWDRYLSVFKNIYVLARVKNDESFIGEDKNISSKVGVVFLEIPYYVGLIDFVKNYSLIKKTIKEIVELHQKDYFICRVPGILGNIVTRKLKRKNKKYALEIVGDPWEVFARNSVKTSMRPFIRVVSYLSLRKATRNAEAVLYVTEKTLQDRYPAVNAKYITTASNVMLYDDQLSLQSKDWHKKEKYQITSIGSLAQLYKAPDIIIKSLHNLHSKGFKCYLTWLGDGVYLKEMKELVVELKLQNYVSFQGSVNKESVIEFLQESDLFVLASRTEGLPRALIEAMAQGLPCIGTKVGGIPELIDDVCLVKANSVMELANKIQVVLTNEILYNSQARRNLDKAHKYRESLLSKRRNNFYNYIVKNFN